METTQLFRSCKIGDLSKVQYLVEEEGVDVNLRDNWDTTPLYYACLCGHEKLVEYLLERGAHCEESTFDGERCLYAALNDQIRHTLRKKKAITSKTMRRDRYGEFLRRLMEGDQHYTDVTFLCHGQTFRCHRCIISCRCPFLAHLLSSKWRDRSVVSLNHKLMDPVSFRLLLTYVYTGHMEVNVEDAAGILRLAQQCQLEDLTHELEKNLKNLESFHSTKPGVHVSVFSIESPASRSILQDNFFALASLGLPSSVNPMVELPFCPDLHLSAPDVCFLVEGHKFFGHQAFFCGRSDYFKTLLMNHFGEVQEETIPIVTLRDVRPSVFTPIMCYLYTDQCEFTPEEVYDVLAASDRYLLPGLMRQCGSFVAQCIDAENVIGVLQSARMFNLAKLEDKCAEFIAQNIDVMVKSEEFHKQVLSDAGEVIKREETDSLGIVDEVRYHVTSHVQTFSEIEEADVKLLLIDGLLEKLGLDG